jgi:RNA polymerase sigma-70 factor, ECF subfamily
MSQADDHNADFAQAALRHLDALFGYAMALARNQAEAEDLAQETYLRAVRAFGQLPPDSNLKGWLFTILHNVWRNQLRHAHSGPQFVELDAEDAARAPLGHDAGDGPHAALLRKAESADVRAAIERLPRPYREVVALRDLEDFSYQQIAAILGCPAGTVMSRLARARGQLRQSLAQWRTATATK